jgi:hypothetical protein
MKFYLGTHMPHWLERLDVPLFVSHRRLARRVSLPVARTVWALDSGGFTELSMFGEWRTTPTEYAAAVRRYRDEIGQLAWAAPQDWMVEDFILRRTGLTVADHQVRTVENYDRLRTLDPQLPFVPVIQGQTLDDYRRHVDAYDRAGIDLHTYETVGIGSVCRRQSTIGIAELVANLTADGLNLHGFGMKISGLRRVGHWMRSADSMAWPFEGRRIQLDGCHGHATEANCQQWALLWRDRVVSSIAAEPAQLTFGGAA